MSLLEGRKAKALRTYGRTDGPIDGRSHALKERKGYAISFSFLPLFARTESTTGK